MNVLSIQSHVAYGHVGNSVAAFALQRMGHEVWAVPTVQFSNHPAHGQFGGCVNSPALVHEIVEALYLQGFLKSCNAVLSGYLGSVHVGDVLVDSVDRCRKENPQTIFFCDPVFGHPGRGIFAMNDIPNLMRDRILPVADIVAPNQFELEWLTGQAIGTMAEAIAAARMLQARGPETVLCTSLRRRVEDSAKMETLLVNNAGAWLVETPCLQGEMFGAGDLFAALYLGQCLLKKEPAECLSQAVSCTYCVLEATARNTAGKFVGELKLISAQDELVKPSKVFTAHKIQ